MLEFWIQIRWWWIFRGSEKMGEKEERFMPELEDWELYFNLTISA